MTKHMDPVVFAQSAVNNLATMIHDMAKDSDGHPRDLDSTVTAGVLAAQGQLAIASSLLVIAQAIGRDRS